MVARAIITEKQRRDRLVRRHHLAADAAAGSVADAAHGVLALHATDPATVYLSVLARNPDLTLADVSNALYVDRVAMRMMAMRRTLFVVPLEHAAVVQAAASQGVAERAWRQLAAFLQGPTDPPMTDVDGPAWLRDVADSVATIVRERGPCTAAEIVAAEPRLRTQLLPVGTKAYDIARAVTSLVLTAVGADGRIVRGEPQGGWTSRRHRWESADLWWPAEAAPMEPSTARPQLVERWLRRFGPATLADVQWWTGWTLGDTRKALAELDLIDTDLDGTAGIVLADDLEPDAPAAPTAALLPALDPTAMGWKHRDWYFAVDRLPLFDRNGNVGPTVWWDGQVVGGWATRATGDIVWRLYTDIGADGGRAVEQVAAGLQRRLAGSCVVPSFRTPLEQELSR